MQFKEFDYDVFVMVELSGHELLFLRDRAKQHYDGSCKGTAEVGGFLYGFCNHWMMESPDPSAETMLLHNKRGDLDRKTTIKMSGRQLDMLAKICEFNTDPNPMLQTLDFVRLLNQRKSEYERIAHANI